MDWITIKTFTHPNEAYIAQSLVASGDIPTFLKDETIVTVYNLYSNAVGGAKLQVPAAEVDKALEILSDCGFTGDVPVGAYGKRESFPITNMMECPYCGSHNVYEERRPGWGMILGIMALNLPLPLYNDRCHCFDCGRKWKTHL